MNSAKRADSGNRSSVQPERGTSPIGAVLAACASAFLWKGDGFWRCCPFTL